jgi:hypothetical protein
MTYAKVNLVVVQTKRDDIALEQLSKKAKHPDHMATTSQQLIALIHP